MEKYDGDLSTLVSTHQEKAIILNMALERMDAYLSIIHYSCDICLNDIKIQNILYKQTGPTQYSLAFSDFGNSSMYSDEICIQRDRENFKNMIASF